MSKSFKVDRVQTVSEAQALEAAGADIICVSLDPDPRFGDFRQVSVAVAAAIKSALHRTQFMVELDLDATTPDRLLHLATTLDFDRIQTRNAVPTLEVRRVLARQRIDIGYAHIEVAHDDDPEWILSRYQDVSEFNPAYFQLNMLPEYEDSWTTWQTESRRYPDEIQISEVNDLARDQRILVELNFTPGNVLEIAAALPDVQALVMTIGELPTRTDLHCAMPDEVLATLSVLRGSSTGRYLPSS